MISALKFIADRSPPMGCAGQSRQHPTSGGHHESQQHDFDKMRQLIITAADLEQLICV